MIVLDTHALVWWLADPDRLGAGAREAIAASLDEARPVHVSAMSVWEVAMLVTRGRLELTIPVEEWIATAEAAPEIEVVPVGTRIALRSVLLEDFPHADPADRMIAATALTVGAALVTADRALARWGGVDTIWA